MKEIATSNYDFVKLRHNESCVYVDKTDILAKLALCEDAQCFIARPRRFGKSLMLSTLRYMFEGRRELFKGLKIEETKWNWSKSYPVVMLNMSKVKDDSLEALEGNLYGVVRQLAKQFKITVDWNDYGSSGAAFAAFLSRLALEKGQFVALVDEYDVPLQGFLGSKDVGRVRGIMHDFYVQLKNSIEAIRFLMITGATKFTKLSKFSGLNNPTDLTMDEPLCAGLLGYTKDEIREFFGDRLEAMAKKEKNTVDAVLKELLDWYDSYCFCPDSKVRVCNPISVGKALRLGKLKSYWVKNASSSLLVERMRALNASLKNLDVVLATDDELDVCDAIEMPLVPLAYQSGYLTIKGKSPTEMDEYGNPKLIFGIPNHEVRGALKSVFWKSLLQIEEKSFSALVRVAEKQIVVGAIDGLISETLYQLYAKLPPTWTPKNEQDAKRYFLLFMEMSGATMHAEKPSARGFADAVIIVLVRVNVSIGRAVAPRPPPRPGWLARGASPTAHTTDINSGQHNKTKKHVWIFEFKFNRSAASAIRQIRDRGYADAYASNNQPITLVGIKFDPNRRNIDIPKFESL